MIRCPGCSRVNVVVRVDGTGRSECADCGTTWRQMGGEQRRIRLAIKALTSDATRFVVDWA